MFKSKILAISGGKKKLKKPRLEKKLDVG